MGWSQASRSVSTFHQPSNRQQTTSEPRSKRQGRWWGEWSQPRTSLLLWPACTACWEPGGGAQTRVLRVMGRLPFLGTFKIPWETGFNIQSFILDVKHTAFCLGWVPGAGKNYSKTFNINISKVAWKWSQSPIGRCYFLYLFSCPGKKGPWSLHCEILTLLSEDVLLPSRPAFPPCASQPWLSHRKTSDNLDLGTPSKHLRKQTFPFCKPSHAGTSLWDALHSGLRIVPLSKTQWTQASESTQQGAENPWPKGDWLRGHGQVPHLGFHVFIWEIALSFSQDPCENQMTIHINVVCKTFRNVTYSYAYVVSV